MIPKETQMREIIDEVDSDYFSSIFKDYYLRLQRGKHLEAYQIFSGLYYFPLDGSQFFSSEEIRADFVIEIQSFFSIDHTMFKSGTS